MISNATTAVESIVQSSGADTLNITNAAHVNAGDVFNGSTDTDTLAIQMATGSNADFRVASVINYEALKFLNTTGFNSASFNASQFGAANAGFLSNAMAITGAAGTQQVFIYGANSFAPAFTFSSWIAGTDWMNFLGAATVDTIHGSVMADKMTGFAGNDIYTVNHALDQVIEAAGEGTDLVNASVTHTLGLNVENLTLTGTTSINGTGNALANVITGNAGTNIIDGKAGADTMAGGLGNDTYFVDDAGDVITEAASAGTDTVNAALTYSLALTQLENLTLTGAAAINGTGNALANKLTGNTGANVLNGDAGNDTLDGGLGADSMNGGAGADTYFVNDAGDSVTEVAGADRDTVNSSVTFTLGNYVESLTLTGTAAINGTGNSETNSILGNAAANVLSGFAGNDTLTGGAGNDTLNGGTGNDTLTGGTGIDAMNGGADNDKYLVDHVSDTVVELANEGTDIVVAYVNYTIGNHVENLTMYGSTGLIGNGNALGNIVLGSTYNNTLYGHGGNDTLDGSFGTDALHGGTGDDLFILNDATDTANENASEGTDTVKASFSMTLGANLENLTLTAAAAINATGNTLNNVLIGSSAANVMYGLAGNDTLDGYSGADQMFGGLGNDIYLVDNVLDVASELGGDGVDVVQSRVTYTLGTDIEDLMLLGINSIAATGNALDNELLGNTGNNTMYGLGGIDIINGGVGSDSMYGGIGDDVYTVDNVGDKCLENAGEGTDSVYAFANYTLSADVEELYIRGTAVSGTGNALANVIQAQGAGALINNYIDGGAGNDFMQGLLGNDVYVVDSTSDIVSEAAGGGNDSILTGITLTLSGTYEVENLELTGTSNVNGTGNALANTITGNSGTNTLSGAAGADTMNGMGGDDILIGGLGADVLTGGTGIDIFKFTAATDSATAGGIDMILDYTTADAIDLVLIDANSGVAGDQAFVLDTDNVMSAGEIKMLTVDSSTYRLELHTNGDGVYDMAINFTGIAPTTMNFYL